MKRKILLVTGLLSSLAWPSIVEAEPSQAPFAELRSGAFVPFSREQSGVEIRGFAGEGGIVVLPENGQLGVLLRELSFLSAVPKLSPLGLAERMAFLFGSDYRLVRRPLDLPRALGEVATQPRLIRGSDDSVTLSFLIKRASHPGRVALYAATLHCSPQYQARLSLSRLR